MNFIPFPKAFIRLLQFWLLVLSFCSCLPAFGQGTVSGKVCDGERNALASVPVFLLLQKDSSVVKSALTESDGSFRFENVQKGVFLVKATMFGCSSPAKKVMMWSNSHISADLCISESVQLQEVKAVSNGISVSGDTTSYVVNHFTSGSERNLKEVLDRLPNVSVDESSKSVTANGKRVNRILLEGQDLFQGNTSIPLENLSADGVRKVDVIDNYSEFNIYDGFKTTNETVLNVGVDDKTKNRIKGEVEGSGGLRNKYYLRNSSLYIGRKSMVSAIIASNNIGNRLLTFQDIMQFSGGLGNLLSGENPMDEFSKKLEVYSAFTDSRRDIFKRDNSLVSLNFTSNPTPKVKLSVGGIYGYDHYRSRRESRYSYLSGLEYSEEARANSNQHNGLVNVKLVCAPSEDFNIIYSGNLLLASQDKEDESSVMEQNDLAFNSSPKTLNVKNNLLVAKRFDQNVLNFSLDYSVSNYKAKSAFRSTYGYYPSSLAIDTIYDYDYRNREDVYAAQLFYLLRLSDTYYLRLALRGEADRQHFATVYDSLSDTSSVYDNDARLDYTSCYAEAMLGKDMGDLTFSLRLRYVLDYASTDALREVENKSTNLLSPMLQLKYQFNPYHFLMLDYEYTKKRNTIRNFIDNRWLTSYNQMEYSSSDNLYSPSHKVTLSHLLSLQFVGLNLINTASFEDIKDPIVSNYYQAGYVSCVEKLQGSSSKSFSIMSSAEYKFLNVPLNVRYNLSYSHSRNPMYYSAVPYDAASNTLSMMAQLVTFYKKGFNGDLKWQISNSAYSGVPSANRLTTNDVTGKLAWQNDKIYASIDARLSTYCLSPTNSKNMYYGFEFRYDLKKNIMLKLNGTDVAHISERRQMTGSSTSYYSINSLTWYMPGHIMVGVSFKY